MLTIVILIYLQVAEFYLTLNITYFNKKRKHIVIEHWGCFTTLTWYFIKHFYKEGSNVQGSLLRTLSIIQFYYKISKNKNLSLLNIFGFIAHKHSVCLVFTTSVFFNPLQAKDTALVVLTMNGPKAQRFVRCIPTSYFYQTLLWSWRNLLDCVFVLNRVVTDSPLARYWISEEVQCRTIPDLHVLRPWAQTK